MGVLNWLKRRLAGEEVEIEFEENEMEFSGLNMKQVIDAHMAWRHRLEAVIKGTGHEQLNVREVEVDNLCALGKWIHGSAKPLYGRLPEYRDLYKAHANFHLLAGEILKENNRGNHDAALVLLRGGFTELSNRVQLDIIRLYSQAKR